MLPQDTTHLIHRPCYQRGSPCQDQTCNRTTWNHKDLLTIIKRCKLQWYGCISRSLGLAKTILRGTVKGGRRRGRQKQRWEDNITEWTGLEFAKSQRAEENKEIWRTLVVKSSVVPQRPSWWRDRWRWWWWIPFETDQEKANRNSVCKSWTGDNWQSPRLEQTSLANTAMNNKLNRKCWHRATPDLRPVSWQTSPLPLFVESLPLNFHVKWTPWPLRLIRDGEVGGLGIWCLTPRYTVITAITLP